MWTITATQNSKFGRSTIHKMATSLVCVVSIFQWGEKCTQYYVCHPGWDVAIRFPNLILATKYAEKTVADGVAPTPVDANSFVDLTETT